MASLTPKNLYIGADTASNIYTAGSNVGDYSIVKLINVCNSNTTTAKSFSIHILTPTDNSATSNNMVASNVSVSANSVVQIDTAIVLNQDYSLYFVHNGNISAVVSGVEYK